MLNLLFAMWNKTSLFGENKNKLPGKQKFTHAATFWGLGLRGKKQYVNQDLMVLTLIVLLRLMLIIGYLLRALRVLPLTRGQV